VVQAGPTAEVLTRPRSETAARLLDIPNIFSGWRDGEVLRWGPHRLCHGEAMSAQGECRFAILPQNVLLVRPDRPLGNHLENVLDGRVSDVMLLGTEALVWIEPAGLPELHIQMHLPVRALERYRVEPDSCVKFSLRAAEIVLLER
jgi:molybdate transport system ATP-binding protein